MNQQNITTGIAFLSFVLSIILGIIEIRRYKSRIRVEISQGNFYDKPGEYSEKVIEIRAMNLGFGAIYIHGGGWLKKDGSSIAITNPLSLEFPLKLEERQSISIYFPCKWFKKLPDVDSIVSAYIKDGTSKTWKCRLSARNLRKLLTYEADGWLIGVSKEDKRQYFRATSESEKPVPFYAEGFISSKIK